MTTDFPQLEEFALLHTVAAMPFTRFESQGAYVVLQQVLEALKPHVEAKIKESSLTDKYHKELAWSPASGPQGLGYTRRHLASDLEVKIQAGPEYRMVLQYEWLLRLYNSRHLYPDFREATRYCLAKCLGHKEEAWELERQADSVVKSTPLFKACWPIPQVSEQWPALMLVDTLYFMKDLKHVRSSVNRIVAS